MTTYYVSNGGNDSFNGLSPTKAWKTLAKVKTFPFAPGDMILLKRGNRFDERLTFDAPSFTDTVLVGAYGKGDKPKLTGYKIANDPGLWTPYSGNVWRMSLAPNSGYGGYQGDDSNVGFLNIDNNIYGRKKKAVTDLTAIGANPKQWDFYSDMSGKFLFVYSEGNPTTLAKNIEIAVNVTLVNKRNYLTVQDLEVTGSGGHGFGGSGNNVNIYNCDIHALGGSVLPSYGDGTVRFGNGIEFFDSGEDIEIEFNKIYDIYDVAFTVQGGGSGFENILVRQNIIYNCTQSFEIWTSTTSTKLKNILFDENECINAGYGWGWDVRPDQGSDVHLLLYNIVTPKDQIDITLRGNVFYNPRGALYYGSQSLGWVVPYKSERNIIFLREGQKIHKQYSLTVEQSDDFVNQLGVEGNSSFHIISDVPRKLDDILSSIATQVANNRSKLKAVQNSIGKLNSSVKHLKQTTPKGQINNGESEVKHLNGYVKPSGGYSTKSSSTTGNYYAPLAKINITSSANVRFHMVAQYMVGGDSEYPSNGIGLLNLQVTPAANLSAGTQVDLDVIEFLDFTSLSTYTAKDFTAVIEKENGEVLVGLYFNIGKDDWMSMSFQPLNILFNGTDGDSFKFLQKADLLTSLPAGTKVNPIENYKIKPRTGSGAPTVIPTGVGQRYQDTTNKKVYEAFGTSSTSDWVLLN